MVMSTLKEVYLALNEIVDAVKRVESKAVVRVVSEKNGPKREFDDKTYSISLYNKKLVIEVDNGDSEMKTHYPDKENKPYVTYYPSVFIGDIEKDLKDDLSKTLGISV
jgi:hypothetical protein